MTLRRSGSLKRGTIKRGGKIRPKKRSAAEFRRVYGSVERVQFVMDQPCAACKRLWASENAHVLGNDGLSRKKGYATIAPLCGWSSPDNMGCHRLYDTKRSEFTRRFPDFDPEAEARKLENAWRQYQARGE